MIKRIRRYVKGIKTYYARDGLRGVFYYIRHRIYNRLISPIIHSNLLIPFNPERQLTRKMQSTFSEVNSDAFIEMGNYYVSNKAFISSESIVYSLGVLADTDFDQAIQSEFGCDIFLFDPSNIAKSHIDRIKNPKFIFEQIGIWNSTCEMEFSTPLYGGSPSMVLKYSGKTFKHKCVDLKEVMEKNKHNSIDVIKLDIEGAAFVVINRMLELQVYPKQIIAEFERPRTKSPEDFFEFFTELIALRRKLAQLGYSAFCQPREKFKYFSLELIFVKSN